jgi:hypothetical protein
LKQTEYENGLKRVVAAWWEFVRVIRVCLRGLRPKFPLRLCGLHFGVGFLVWSEA